MKKRGMSEVIGSVLLVLISITLGIFVFITAKNLIDKSKPPIDCVNTNFRAEIFFNNTGFYYADIVNDGYIDIKGFIIKDVSVGTKTLLEESEEKVSAGETKKVRFHNVSASQKEILMIPLIVSLKDPTNQTIGTCKDEYGVRLAVPLNP